MAIDYYAKLDFGDGELSHISEAAPESRAGLKESDLTCVEKLAMVKIRGKLATLIGTTNVTALHTTWTAATESTYGDIIPMEIQDLARLLSSSAAWRMEEAHHGIEERLDEKRSKPASKILLDRAIESWTHIKTTKKLHSMNGTIVDLASYTDAASGVGIASADGTFFPDNADDTSFDLEPVFSTEGALRSAHSVLGGWSF